ncbi:hypothetical protein [Oceanobacillus sp. 1P07AA]|uniref:hypothetical protein n=1 Tax=Oceanobacillus sp. 1P07AA TaxID=3132293 RepID=UPI0039A6E17B
MQKINPNDLLLKPASEIYFAYPKAADEPPVAHASGSQLGLPPTGQGRIRQHCIARRKLIFIFKESPFISYAYSSFQPSFKQNFFMSQPRSVKKF